MQAKEGVLIAWDENEGPARVPSLAETGISVKADCLTQNIQFRDML